MTTMPEVDRGGPLVEGSMLEGTVALVSGIGPGMGRDISLALAAQGADLVLGARSEKRTAAVAAEVEAMGRSAIAVTCDITAREDCDRIVAAARDRFGRLDVLVNNAFQGGNDTTFAESDLADWRTTMDVNLFGTLELTQAALPLLTERDDSRIVMINTMSVNNIEARFGAYAASKAALATATKTLARELGPEGVRVNSVHPGYIWGRSVEWFMGYLAEQRGVTAEDVYGELADQTCLGYLPHSQEIAGTVLYLASPLARPVTGQSINVDCGHWI